MEVIQRNCSICNSDEFVEAFKQHYSSITGFGNVDYIQKIVICKKCGFTYVNPAPSLKEFSKYYRILSNYENPQLQGRASSESISRWNRTYWLIKKRIPQNFTGRVLEIGCATAVGLSVFKSNGWDVLGIEPSPNAAKLAQKLYDIDVITGSFDLKFFANKEQFDVIILSHVLEHIISLELIITDLRSILATNGVIYIEVPNLLRPFVPMGYFSFEHLNYFTPTTLSNLMDVNGFSVDMIELFDNSSGYDPFYPVITSTYKRAKKRSCRVTSDYNAAYRAVSDYRETTGKEVLRLQSRIDFIITSTKPGRLGIWGAGIHTSQLLSLTELAEEKIACIFDNDQKKQDKHLNGVKIVPLGKPEEVKNAVDGIIISSKASESEIYEQIRYLQRYGVKVFKLYDIQ